MVLQRFKKEQFTVPPAGFGALLNRDAQHSGLLGILFSSHLFPDRAPANTVSTRSILGGSIVPSIVEESDTSLKAMALHHHQTLFKSPNLTPSFAEVIKWSQAIPQYNVGHLSIQDEVHQFHSQHPHLRISGNHLFGVAIKDCIRTSKEFSNHFTQSPQ